MDFVFIEDEQKTKQPKIDPFITITIPFDLSAYDMYTYVDKWVPGPKDVIFTSVVGAIIVPVCDYYKYNGDSRSLDMFVTSTKKCYNSDLMREHYCHYMNYFEKFYDSDKEYFSVLCQIKYAIDNGITNPYNGTIVEYDIAHFMNDLRRYVLSPSLVNKVGKMCWDNYILDLNYKNINNPSLQYNDDHARLLMQCSILINLCIPLLTHYAYMKKIATKIDEFLLQAFDYIFDLFKNIDIYNKLYETSSTNIAKNEQANSVIWAKQDIRGRNVTTHSISSVNNIILNIMPKYVFNQNIVSMNYSSIINNTGFQITDIGFEFTFIPLSSSKKDEDNQSDSDKYESNLIKQDESKYLAVEVNAYQTMKVIESMYGPFSEEELQYYYSQYGENNWQNSLQKQLIFLMFYKYFGDSESIKNINKRDYFCLMIAAKRILLNNNMIMLPYIISGKIDKMVGRKSLNKKESLKLESSENYPEVLDKYKNDKIIKIILGYMATIISSDFRIIDLYNPAINGKMIDVIPDIIIEEMLMFALLV